MPPGLDRLRPAHAAPIAAAVLTLAYLWSYFSAQGLPGNLSGSIGWWNWFDQGKTLESARAFGSWDLSATRHWYPPGYSLLGAPFIGAGLRAHPFVLVDLACLLAAFGAFLGFASTCGLPRPAAAVLFTGAVLWPPQMAEWAIPWNSTPAAALMWGVLAACGQWLAGQRRPVLLGALAAAMPAFRPTDTGPVAVCLLWVLVADWRAGTLRARSLAMLLLGVVLAAVPQLVLHVLIHGPHPSGYMVQSRAIGFTPYDFPWKAYVLLADPTPWFTDGAGMLQRLPWMALGLAGIIPALLRGRATGLLAAALCAHGAVYLSYLDLLPTGLWRYNNIHYWKWTGPGYALLAWLLVLDLVRWRRALPSYAAAGSLLVAGALASLRIAPRPAAPDEPAKMLVYHGPAPGFDQTYWGALILHDAGGTLANVSDMRAFPVPGGMRVIALSRPFAGPVAFDRSDSLPPGLVDGQPDRFAEHWAIGWPCWLPAGACGPRERNGLLPPTPGR